MSASGQLCFSRDESIARWREHSISLDRNKRFTQTPRALFSLGLSAVEWSVFMYYYSLTPGDHPGEEHVSARLCIGRKTLRQALFRLHGRGMVFFHGLRRSSHRLVNISHPAYWSGLRGAAPAAGTTDPGGYEPVLHLILPERKNEAKDYFKGPGQHIALPYLLFQLSISPIAKILYGLICHLGIYDHPTTEELATAVGCSADTAARNLSFLVEAGMLDFTVREPDSFGSRVRYYYHTCAVGRWRFRKAQVWYPDSRPASTRDTANAHLMNTPRDDHEDFKFSDRPALRLISYQLGQIAPQLGQSASQLGQVSSQPSAGPHRMPVLEGLCRESAETKENKNKEENHKQKISKRGELAGSSVTEIDSLSKRWNPEKRTFSPRIINTAKAASFAWEPRGLRFDPTLWTGFVEDVALERGEEGACEFAEYAIKVRNLRGSILPYDVLVMRRMKKAFLGGVSPESLLVPEDPEAPVGSPEVADNLQPSSSVHDRIPQVEPAESASAILNAPESNSAPSVGLSLARETKPDDGPMRSLPLPEDPELIEAVWNRIWRSLTKTQKPLLIWDLEKQGSKGAALKAFAVRSMEFWVLVEEKAALEKGNVG
jgi:hypothetical protein